MKDQERATGGDTHANILKKGGGHMHLLLMWIAPYQNEERSASEMPLCLDMVRFAILSDY